MIKMLFSFQGRINRKPFWLFMIAIWIVEIFIVAFDKLIFGDDWGPLTLIFLLVVIVPSLAMQTKRWHDRDKSGWWILIGLIPIIGPLWAFIETGFLKGTESRNRFGDNPLRSSTEATIQ